MLIPLHLFKEEADIDLHESEFLRNSFLYRLYLSGPNLVDTLNFGDGHDRRSAHSRMMLYRLASLYGDGHAQWLAEHFEATGEWEREGQEGLVKPGLLPEAWMDFVWFDPAVEAAPVQSLPLAHVLPDMGVVSARSSWGPQATVLGFKCGTPNGARGWHVGQAIDRANGWDVITASHEHPDENSFILIRGGDYLAVDEGYSKEKLSRNHSTVLIDGRGQYNEGSYNAFRGLDQGWGGRLNDWFLAPNLTAACGEAAGAYDPALQLSRFRRQIVMSGDDLILICDDLRSAVAHEYQWLLQTDVAAEQKTDNQFVYHAGATQMTVTAVAPTACQSAQRAQEITANPTSAKPDWIIRRTQHTLELLPPVPGREARFVVALDLADRSAEAAEVVALDCVGGTAVEIVRQGQTRVAAFADGQSRLVIPNLFSTDASWVVLDLTSGELWAGSMTNLWLNGELQCLAMVPTDIALLTDACVLDSERANWISIRKPASTADVRCNNQHLPTQPNPALNLIRFHVESGVSRITWEKKFTEVA